MRLDKLYLQNYIGIYNGIGRTDFSIDFSKCKNLITVIRGDNGSGKSTLFKALNPFNDPPSSLIPGVEAKKYISYKMDTGEVINIMYTYPVSASGERKSAKCSIIKVMPNGDSTELNPNGNITEAKEMISTIFDFDQTFTILSQLSSENRGIADRKPAERKQLINSIMESLSTYNDIYKKLAKKSSALKSMIHSINTKITSIGDVSSIQSNIKRLEEELGKLEDEKNQILVTCGKLNGIIDNTDVGVIMDDLHAQEEKIKTLSQVLKKANNNTESIKDLMIDIDDSKIRLEKAKIAHAKATASNEIVIPKMTDLSNKINKIAEELKSYSDVSNYESLKEKHAEINANLEEVIAKRNKISASNISQADIQSAIDASDKINSIKTQLSVMDYDIRSEAATSLFDTNYISYNKDMNVLLTMLSDLEYAYSMQTKYRKEAELYDNIPKECTLKDKCCFVKNIVESNELKISDEEYEKFARTISEVKDEIEQVKNNGIRESKINRCKSLMNSIISIYNSKKDIFKVLGFDLSNQLAMEEFLSNTADIRLNTDIYTDITALDQIITSVQYDLKVYEDRIKAIEDSVGEYNRLKKTIDEYSKDYNSYKELFIKNDNIITSSLSDITQLTEKIEILEETIDALSHAKEIENEIKELSKAMIDNSNTLDTITKYKQQLRVNLDQLEFINTKRIPETQAELNKLKYNLVLYNDYIAEYKTFSNKFNMIETVKKYTSPTTGIQTIFMSVYMNDVINIANQLLSMMFNGEFVLYPFVINESEFRIPCSGSGYLNDDISSMSTSQICLISTIISFALLHKSSNIYNIAMLDEIDGGLDHTNRLHFISLLIKLMGVLNFNQTIMISHNSELDMSNCDVIIMRNSDPNLKLEGNIIFNANV